MLKILLWVVKNNIKNYLILILVLGNKCLILELRKKEFKESISRLKNLYKMQKEKVKHLKPENHSFILWK